MLRSFLFFTLILSSLLLASTYIPVVPLHNISISNAHIEEIYHKLIINAGQTDIPPLIIADNEVINAWTDGETITITTGIISQFTNDDEVALVLGHELAHYITKDVENTLLPTIQLEANADKLGAFIMMRSGYDICKGRSTFAIFKQLMGDGVQGDHPDNAFRYNQLNIGCEPEMN